MRKRNVNGFFFEKHLRKRNVNGIIFKKDLRKRNGYGYFLKQVYGYGSVDVMFAYGFLVSLY